MSDMSMSGLSLRYVTKCWVVGQVCMQLVCNVELSRVEMSTFSVESFVTQHNSTAVNVEISKPTQISCWTKTSKDQGSQVLFGDQSGLLPYTPPHLPADLNEGFENKYTKKDESEASPVDTIVQAATAAGVDWSSVNICTYRNNLNKILLTPYGDTDWAIDCCYWGNTLFLDINKTGNVEYPNQDKFVYYGYKFEALCTGEEQVDSSSEFAVVLQYRLGSHSVVMAAEVDAAKEEGEGPLGGKPYVELKTYKIPGHYKAVQTMYKEKHPRWWVQSFLAGVSTLVLGGRNHTGQLQKVQEVPVQLLPGLSAKAGHPWDPSLLLAFGEAVLAWMVREAKQHAGKQLHVTYSNASGQIQSSPVQGDMPQRLRQLLPQ